MNGHVGKVGSKWHYIIEMAKVGGKRQRMQKGGWDTKSKAQEHLREAMKTYREDGKVDLKEMSVADYLDYWMETYVEKKLKYDTQKNYQNVVDKYLKPEIGKFYLTSITPARL